MDNVMGEIGQREAGIFLKLSSTVVTLMFFFDAVVVTSSARKTQMVMM
jgi:hypothetical protein